MEYEAKKGKKVGGSVRGTGLRTVPEAGVERGAGTEVANVTSRACLLLWKDLPFCPWQPDIWTRL